MSRLKTLWVCSWVGELISMACLVIAVAAGNTSLAYMFIVANAICFIGGGIIARIRERQGYVS